ncbi:MAG: hypothetical protein V3U44_11065 [Alphaproteobacteria bacterium]
MVRSHAPLVVLLLCLASTACAPQGERVQEISEREHRECLALGYDIASGAYATCRRLKAEHRARAEDRDRGNRLMTR